MGELTKTEKIDRLQDMEGKMKNQNWTMLSIWMFRYLTIQGLRVKIDLELKWEVKVEIQIRELLIHM